MSGTVWPSLVAGAKAKASEVESKFDWMEGDFLPFSAGTKTDQTYDLGSSSFKWVDGWFSGRVYVGAGNAAAASLTRWDDTDTGTFWPAANTLAHTVGGRQYVTYENTGAATNITFSNDGAIGDMTFLLEQDRNQPNEDCLFHIRNGGTSAGDTYFRIEISNGEIYAVGIDNDDGDSFKISDNSTLGTNDRFILTSTGIIQQPSQCCFLAYNSATDANVTGNGVNATVDFDTEVFDPTGSFSADTFVAPVDGKYLLTAKVQMNDLAASAHNTAAVRIVTSNRTYQTTTGDGTIPSANNNMILSVTVVADMDAADTAFVQVNVAGGSQDVDVVGGTNTTGGGTGTVFSGSLLN